MGVVRAVLCSVRVRSRVSINPFPDSVRPQFRMIKTISLRPENLSGEPGSPVTQKL